MKPCLGDLGKLFLNFCKKIDNWQNMYENLIKATVYTRSLNFIYLKLNKYKLRFLFLI